MNRQRGDMVLQILTRDRRLAREKDNKGKLPLHQAVEYQAPVRVVAALLEAHPDGAKTRDDSGRLPLQLATECQAPAEVVSALIGAYPEGAAAMKAEKTKK